jgi:Animal haem peroxidase
LKSTPGSGYRKSVGWRIFNKLAQAVDHRFGWHKLPTSAGLTVLTGVRNMLRQRNLYDTGGLPTRGAAEVPPWQSAYATIRTPDGTYNDLSDPAMGRAGSRFGRNVPLDEARVDRAALMDPNPRTVSRELMTRREFQAVEGLNALVAAWLQFMIHDWFSHGPGPTGDVWEVPLVEDDPWHEHPMPIPKTPADPTRPDAANGQPPTFVNTETHWWDGSSLYGTNLEHQQKVRSGTDGKLRTGPDSLLPRTSDRQMDPTQVPGWWLGLSMLTRLFLLEHNAICDRLKLEYPSWSDEDLFQRARLINAAVLAKIHTVEWTPAVISHPTTKVAMHANWYGLAGKRVTELFGRLGDSEVVSGIPGSPTAHYGVPYSLTEEFTSVYRMHPLIPDDWTFRRAADDGTIEERPFRELTGSQAPELEERIALTDLLYSFGRLHPGLVRLHNFPRDLQTFERPDGRLADLAATDILRTRELGVPRYNQFRRLLNLKPATSFETLTDVPQWADEIRRVYNDDIEKVDLIVGMFAEPLPRGFGFSDTAFRIFIVMASRRLNSDRFFTRDYTPQVYSPVGMQWIDETTMSTVLLRHCPELRPALRGLDNAFTPFNPATG